MGTTVLYTCKTATSIIRKKLNTSTYTCTRKTSSLFLSQTFGNRDNVLSVRPSFFTHLRDTKSSICLMYHIPLLSCATKRLAHYTRTVWRRMSGILYPGVFFSCLLFSSRTYSKKRAKKFSLLMLVRLLYKCSRSVPTCKYRPKSNNCCCPSRSCRWHLKNLLRSHDVPS